MTDTSRRWDAMTPGQRWDLLYGILFALGASQLAGGRAELERLTADHSPRIAWDDDGETVRLRWDGLDFHVYAPTDAIAAAVAYRLRPVH